MRDFGVASVADFEAGSAGATNFALVSEEAGEMKQSGATQTSGANGEATMQKGVELAELREDLKADQSDGAGFSG